MRSSETLSLTTARPCCVTASCAQRVVPYGVFLLSHDFYEKKNIYFAKFYSLHFLFSEATRVSLLWAAGSDPTSDPQRQELLPGVPPAHSCERSGSGGPAGWRDPHGGVLQRGLHQRRKGWASPVPIMPFFSPKCLPDKMGFYSVSKILHKVLSLK